MRRMTLAVMVMTAVLLGATVAASAVTPGGDVQANSPQVAGDPTSDTTAVFPTNKQNEPTVAVNPVDSRFLIAGSNDEQRQPPCGPGPVRGAAAQPNDCSFFPGVGTDGVYTSADRGQTWVNRGLLDDQASWQGKGVISDGDPVIAFGPRPDAAGHFSYANGVRAYYSSLATIGSLKGQEHIIVSSSDDNGATWSAPVMAATKTSAADFNDKSWVTVDDNAASPYFGRVYLSWTEFRSKTATGNGSEPVMVTSSADGGRSFAAPDQLSAAYNNRKRPGRQGSSVTTGPDGRVYVAFEQLDKQVVSISRDGGKSFGKLIIAGTVADIADPIPGANFRTDSFPTIGADPRAGSNTVYLAWANRTAAGGRIVVARSIDGGATWAAAVTVSGAAQGYAFFQGLDVAPDGRVDVGFQGLTAIDPSTFGGGNASIDSWATSMAAGGSWSAPVKVSTASSDPAASAQNNLARQFWGDYNQVASTSAGAFFIFTDSRNGQPCSAVDGYQVASVGSAQAAREDMDDLMAVRNGVNPSASDPVVKPAPGLVCPGQFGNTNIVVARWTP